MASGERIFLFLQGHPSTFAAQLARAFQDDGHKVLRINLCSGDWLFWRLPGAYNYRGRPDNWPQFLRDFVREHGVTDLVYYADRLPYHRAAIGVAHEMGLRCYVYEFGYLRPDWITLERGGMSAHSHFPNDPDAIRAVASRCPEPDLTVRYHHTFTQEAMNEVLYNMSNFWARPFYPFYNAERYYNTLVDYISYIPRLLAQRRRGRRAYMRTDKWIRAKMRYFLVPLQMQSDYQLRANSPFPDQRALIDVIMKSFAAHGVPGDCLVFKIHPLDNGYEQWSVAVGHASRRHGLEGRVHPIDGGDLGLLVSHAQGVVMNNSTVGIHALRAGRPVKSLGMALFDVPGLTHQGPLDTFWRNPTPPDKELMEAFVKAVAATIQVKGSFFSPDGRRSAIAEIKRRILADEVNALGALVVPPPRLADARAGGVPHADWPERSRIPFPAAPAAPIEPTDPSTAADGEPVLPSGDAG